MVYIDQTVFGRVCVPLNHINPSTWGLTTTHFCRDDGRRISTQGQLFFSLNKLWPINASPFFNLPHILIFQLSSLVGIADPTVSYLACTASSCSPPDAARSSTGIYTSCSTSTPSSGTADCVATNLLNTYYLSGAIGSAASTSIPATNGIGAVTTVALGKTSSGSSIHKDVALTVHDFNLFRKKVAEAINTLDKKIESILAISAPTC